MRSYLHLEDGPWCLRWKVAYCMVIELAFWRAELHFDPQLYNQGLPSTGKSKC